MVTPTPDPVPRSSGSRTRFTLRQKLTVSLMTVGLCSLFVAGLVYVSWDLVRTHGALRERTGAYAERIGRSWAASTSGAASLGWPQDLLADGDIASASLIDDQGRVLADLAGARHEPDAGGASTLLAPVARYPVFAATELVGTVVVRADGGALWRELRLHAGVLLMLVGTSILLTLGLARRIHRRFSDQLLDLAHAANAISTRKDYSIRAMRRSDDEIGLLVDTFNHMITQIELRDLQLKAEIKRAEAARTAKAQFLATMSHEIRTPINGVLGMTQLLLDTSLSAEQDEFARTIHSSAEGLLSIINDILDFSKGEAGRYELEEIPFDVAQVVGDCLSTVAIVAAEKELELCLDVDPRVPARVVGDPARLRQVLLNLLSNSLKFTTEGEILLRVQLEEDQGRHARLRFEVQDTGIGIPPDRVDRLFKSFSQVDASSSRKYGGTGLGLAISKQIVEAMGGTMLVKTEAGVGSTFGFKLQLPVETPADQEHARSPHSLRLLIADPSPTSGGNIARMLREENTVEVTTDALAARSALLRPGAVEQPFDVLLLDLRLAEALDHIDLSHEHRTALVVLAPVNQLSSVSTLPWNGPRASLAKPVKRDDLYWCLTELQRDAPASARAPVEAPRGPTELASAVAAKPAATATDLAAGALPLRVLVAEDHPINQRITTRFLEKLGARWELAENGREAIEAIKRKTFDLVLMDVQMPVMDGLEATLTIRKLEGLHGGRIPIIALTANVLEEHRREAQAAGFDDYLPKPVVLGDLARKLVHWGGRSSGTAGEPGTAGQKVA
jgi:two-component system sensor histidine kinase/response regulator